MTTTMPYINTFNIGIDKGLISVKTLNDKKIHMIYDIETTFISDIIDSFWENYSCKGYNVNNIKMCYNDTIIDNSHRTMKARNMCGTVAEFSLKIKTDMFHGLRSKHDSIDANFIYKDEQKKIFLTRSDDPEVSINKIKNEFRIEGNVVIKKNNSPIGLFEVFNGDHGTQYTVVNSDKYTDNGATMRLFVKSLTGSAKTYTVCKSDKIDTLMHNILGPNHGAKLIWKGKELHGKYTYDDYGIEEEDTIHMVLCLRGGMFHETSGKNGNYENLTNILVFVNTKNKKN